MKGARRKSGRPKARPARKSPTSPTVIPTAQARLAEIKSSRPSATSQPAEMQVKSSLTRVAKASKKKDFIFLVCEETGDYNYTIRKKHGTEKLKLKKYCPRLRKHTVHVEKKK